MIKNFLVFYLISLGLSKPRGPFAWRRSNSYGPQPGMMERPEKQAAAWEESPEGSALGMGVTEAAAQQQSPTLFTTCRSNGQCGWFALGQCATNSDCTTNPRFGLGWFCYRLWGSTYGMCARRTSNGQVEDNIE